MADRSIIVRLRADISDFRRQMGDASSVIERNSAHISNLSNQIGAMGLAMVAVAGIAVARFADFDAAMSNVAATGDDARGSLDELRDAALDAGQRTVYSATEAAGAIEELAKAGVAAEDILGGGLDGALDLAAAGSIEVADAAEIAATAMTQFGLSGQDVTHVADLLAAGAGKAQGGVAEMGAALKQTGQVADMTGLSIEETTAGLAAFASAGLLGSDAGTSFKSMLQRLTPQSAEAQQAMDDLGISAYDSQGQFIGLAKFAGNLQTAMADLTPEARNAAMATIFGSDAVRAATVLYDQGAEGISRWISAVDDQGYAAEVAATRLDNLKGDVEQLTGALDTALIGMGEGANGPLRSLTQHVTEVVNAFSDLPEKTQAATLAIVGAGGLALLAVAGVGKVTVAINDARIAMQALNISGKTAGIALGGLGAVLTIATIGVTQWAQANAKAEQHVDGLTESLDQQTAAYTENTRAIVYKELRESGAVDTAKRLGVKLSDLIDASLDPTSAAYRRLAAAADAAQKANQKGFDASDLGASQERVKTYSDYADLLVAVRGQADGVAESQARVRDQIAAGLSTTDAATAATAGLADASGDASGAIDNQVDALSELVDALSKAAGNALSVRDAQAGLEQAYDDATAAIETNGATLDITTQAGRDNQAALDDIAQSGWDLIDSMTANGSTQEELQASMADSRTKFVEVATAMGLSSEAANTLADGLNLIPENVTTTVGIDGIGAAQVAINSFINLNNGRRIQVMVDAVGGAKYQVRTATGAAGWEFNAEGGYIAGPGTSTSDSIPSWLSNGEYVVKASAVQQYGRSFFDGLNAQRFATGGPVGAMPSGGMPAGVDSAGIAAALSGMALTLMIDGQPVRAIARAESVSVLRAATSGRGR